VLAAIAGSLLLVVKHDYATGGYVLLAWVAANGFMAYQLWHGSRVWRIVFTVLWVGHATIGLLFYVVGGVVWCAITGLLLFLLWARPASKAFFHA
jgi:hypothetical protein